jgi:hypothetical protein
MRHFLAPVGTTKIAPLPLRPQPRHQPHRSFREPLAPMDLRQKDAPDALCKNPLSARPTSCSPSIKKPDAAQAATRSHRSSTAKNKIKNALHTFDVSDAGCLEKSERIQWLEFLNRHDTFQDSLSKT